MTRVQLAYPKIPDSKNCPNEQCIAFEKYDGTNLHWVWEIELGWYAFGTRRHRFDLDEMGIAEFNGILITEKKNAKLRSSSLHIKILAA